MGITIKLLINFHKMNDDLFLSDFLFEYVINIMRIFLITIITPKIRATIENLAQSFWIKCNNGETINMFTSLSIFSILNNFVKFFNSIYILYYYKIYIR